tara:strand:+ start:4135 stop:4815 length:681 start_codon:yes stop_codon:yes gene_type:complete
MPAPGFDKWRLCSGGNNVPGSSIGDGSQPSGPELGLYIEYFDAVNGVEGQHWSNSGSGVGSGQWGSGITYDSMMNSSGVNYQLGSQKPSAGEVVGLSIGGQWLGCMMYTGRSSGSPFPSFYPAATPDPIGQIPPGQDHYWEPQQATASQVFSDCYGCVWGATDPGGPIETDWELENPDLEFVKRPPKPGSETIKDREHKEEKPSGEGNERKELREEVNKIKRLIGY